MAAERRCSAAIVGGGPAGAAAAIRLCASGVPTVVIDCADSARDKIGESLPPSARVLLQRLGVWERHCESGHLPCYANRSSWGGGGIEEYSFIRDPNGHGWHLDRRSFDRMLASEAVRRGCEWIGGAPVRRLDRDGAGGWRLALGSGADGPCIRARVLVDASGRRGFVARRMGARRQRFDRLVALVAFLAPARSPSRDSATLVEAVADGWWYSAPLPDGRLACAFLTDADLLRAADGPEPFTRFRGVPAGPDPAAWEERLARSVYTQERLTAGAYRRATPPAVAPAGSALLDRLWGDGWVASGDAAASYDPLASHGIAAAIAHGWSAGEAAVALLEGDTAAAVAYNGQVRRGYRRYLALLAAYYALEERWPGSAFWRRRQSPGARLPEDNPPSAS